MAQIAPKKAINILQAKSEEIDLIHLEFDWNEFRTNGYNLSKLIDKSKPPNQSPLANGHNQSTNNTNNNNNTNINTNNNTLTTSNQSISLQLKTSKIYQHIVQNWLKLNISNSSSVSSTCSLNPLECCCISRLMFILATYHSWCDNMDINTAIVDNISIVSIINNLPSYNQIYLYNDYCHMLDYHSNRESFWLLIRNKFNKCDFSKCRLFIRNHRNRGDFGSLYARKSLYFGYDRSSDVINIQFLDRLHTYLLHSNTNIAEEKNLYQNVIKNNEQEIEQKLRSFAKFRRKRNKELERCQINLANSTKFVTEIGNDNDNDINSDNKSSNVYDNDNNSDNNINNIIVNISGSTDNDDDIKSPAASKINSSELTEYSFGATFKYWDHFSHKKVYCIPKYTNLKQEMLNNNVFTVSEFQWNDTLYKALQIKMSYKGQSLYAINRGGTNNHYSIPYLMPISLSHIMVILFYCNFDSLQRKFKQQCRPAHKKESRQSLNQRNSEIGHWFSLLKEVCWFYGKAMKYGDIFYHGINKTLLFTQFHARFRFPLSTTTSLKEASLFANFHSMNSNSNTKKDNKTLTWNDNTSSDDDDDDDDTDDGTDDDTSSDDDDDDTDDNNGIIIELGYCELCFYIDVQIMSDFPAENEKLFFGADLAIQNIYYQNKSYKKFVSALTLFQSIINGRFFVDILQSNKVYQLILLKMIANFQWKYNDNNKTKNKTKNDNYNDDNIIKYKYDANNHNLIAANNLLQYDNDIPEYIQDLFEYFYLNQHYVWIIKSQLQYLESSLRKYFNPNKNQNQNQNKKHKYVLNLAGNNSIYPQYIRSYPLKYCVEYIWKINGNDFQRFKTMKNGEWINCDQEFIYDINTNEYDHTAASSDNNNNRHRNGINNTSYQPQSSLNNDNIDYFAIFQCSCAPSKTGKHSFFMKVSNLSNNLERILFGVDLYCPEISFKTSVPRRWFKETDYLGYTMFDSNKLKDLSNHFEWHIAIKIYDFKKKPVIIN